jgi:hypothetical protein
MSGITCSRNELRVAQEEEAMQSAENHDGQVHAEIIHSKDLRMGEGEHHHTAELRKNQYQE